MSERKSTTYNLYSTERIYKDETLISYYFQPNKKVVKNFSPVDIDGERYKLNLQTGELSEYKKKDIELSTSASLRRTTIMINMLLSMNDFDWFWTLTFDKDRIDRTNDELVFKCYERYINNIKNKVEKVLLQEVTAPFLIFSLFLLLQCVLRIHLLSLHILLR